MKPSQKFINHRQNRQFILRCAGNESEVFWSCIPKVSLNRVFLIHHALNVALLKYVHSYFYISIICQIKLS